MKLLYVPPLGGGIRDLREAGQHRRLFDDYCRRWLNEFDEVLILSFFDESLENYPELRSTARVRVLPNRWRLHRYLYSWLAPWLHRGQLHEARAMRVSQTTGALPAWFAKRALNIPVVMTYGYDYVLFARDRGRLAAWLARLHERIGRVTADFWIATTQELVTLLQDRHRIEREAIYLIPNGVNLSTFPVREADEDEDLRSLVFVGRLEPQKNLPFLLDCASAAADRLQTRLRLTIIGEGSLRAQLAAHPVSTLLKVELTGAIDQTKLAQAFQEAQLFVTATQFEGHPKAILEAMASGLPVLGRDAPGVTPLLRSAGQPVFTDVDSFVDNFKLLTRSSLRLEAARRAVKLARRDFDIEKNVLLETELLAKAARAVRKETPAIS